MHAIFRAEQFKVLIAELNAKLSHAEEHLQTSNKRMNKCVFTYSQYIVN